MNKFKIGDKWVGDGYPTYVVAEIGNNHNGDINIAKKLIEQAYEAKVDAVKFQIKDVEKSFPKKMLDMPYEKPNSFGKTYREHKEFLEFSHNAYRELQEYANKIGIHFFATPFEEYSLRVLNEMDVPAIKISSFHMTDDDLIAKAVSTGKPLIVSTGMSTAEEVDHAVSHLKNLNATFALLQCTSSYPAAFKDVHLAIIGEFRKKYNCVVGYSGHEDGFNIAASSILFGASIIEKHFTLDRTMKGPDHASSIEFKDMRALVNLLRDLEEAIGGSVKGVLESEEENRKKNRYK